MAVDLHNSDHSLLPTQSQFFSQDHDAFLNKPNNNTWSCFGSSDSGSVWSSPVESELGSTETESDSDEDYIAELTRQMANDMLQDDDKPKKSWGLCNSPPQSTLWPPLGSSHGSPIGPSREPSPPLPIMVEEFEKMKINRHGDMLCHNFSEIPLSMSNPNVEFQSKQALIDDQIRAIQFYRLKQEQAMTQIEHNKKQLKHFQNKAKSCSGFNSGQKTTRPPCSSSTTWTSMSMQQQQSNQQRAGSDMSAVFLGGSGARTGSCGTGVFLPQGISYKSSESRKKTGCSTVLIPARVVQALKQHFDKVGVPSRFNGSLPLQHDALMGGRNSFHSQQQHQSQRQRQRQDQYKPWTVPAVSHQEVGLPQEWTY